MNMSTEAKVGGVTLLGLILLAYMIIHLGGFTFGDKGYPVTAMFNQVSGLKEGNLVRYAGVEVGRVKQVKVTPEGVAVTLIINEGVKIPEGSKISIGTDGLLGEKYINIAPPQSSSGYLQPNSVIKGDVPQDLDKLIATADKVLLDMQKLVNSLNDVFGDEKVKTSLIESAVNARELTNNLKNMSAVMARLAENNEADVNTMVSNLTAMSESLRSVTSRVDKMLADVDNNGQTARDFRQTLENIRVTSERVEKMAASLEGVVTDPETTRDIKETLKNAREVSAKANSMLTKVQEIETEAGFEVLYNSDNEKYKSTADVKISSGEDFAVIGVSNIGNGSKTNLQVGKGTDKFAARAGIVEGEAGIGVDTKLGNQMRLSLDVYDPNDLRVKLRTQYQIAPETYLVGQTDSLNKDPEKNTYIGLRQTF
ncbi:MAG: MCE family protein [Veillonellaceae bacterium]|jgi:phospholipid/cholesterol/gamma-HCH transport system substrate-binding protein|nr:MCE family protein [Veillonellaceae bacterium]